MTIPIDPGPFSFLVSGGQALGAYAQAREAKRQQQLAEAKDQARNYLALRAAGLMKPADFEDPHIQAIFHAAGYGPVSPQETPDEMLSSLKGQYLTGLINPAMAKPVSDEQRAVVGAPERGLTQKINAGIAQNVATTQTAQPEAEAKIAQARATVPSAQLQSAQATAALPGAESTVVAGQQGEQDKTYNDIADRIVRDMFSSSKKLPSSGDAYARSLADPRAQAFKGAITQPYFGAAIDRLRAQLEDETTKRLAAQAREKGAAGTGFDDIARIYQAQQTRLTAELNALDKPSATDQAMAAVAASQRAKGKVPSPFAAAAEGRVGEYQRRRQEIEQQIQQIGDQLTNVTGQMIGAPGTNPPGQSGSPQKRAAAVEYEQRTKGVTDPAKRKAIADEIAKKYNIKVGGAQ